jgi:hypothetical protein
LLRQFQKAYADAQIHALAQTVFKSGGDAMRFFNSKFFALAMAAVVATGGLASSAKAEIVYHSADIGISNGTYNLDVNGDGVTDFTIASTFRTGGSCGTGCTLFWSRRLDETPASGNGAIVGPLRSGQEIGPNEVFDGSQAFMSGVSVDRYCRFTCKAETFYLGSWLGKTGYLGLSFQVNGQTYYGWARLSCGGKQLGAAGTGTLLGYAYETIPGKAILAGQTTYIQFTPAGVDFGTVPLGSTASGSVTLANLGPTEVTITNATLTGLNKADFASENGNPPCAGSVAAGGTCTLTLTFTPSILGKEWATYLVYDNTGGTPQKLPLKGTGQ